MDETNVKKKWLQYMSALVRRSFSGLLQSWGSWWICWGLPALLRGTTEAVWSWLWQCGKEAQTSMVTVMWKNRNCFCCHCSEWHGGICVWLGNVNKSLYGAMSPPPPLPRRLCDWFGLFVCLQDYSKINHGRICMNIWWKICLGQGNMR